MHHVHDAVHGTHAPLTGKRCSFAGLHALASLDMQPSQITHRPVLFVQHVFSFSRKQAG